MKAHRENGHKFLHIGLVQVGVKPLIREGLNNSILMALRDTRLIRFNDSLLGTIESSLSNGPIHFDCFPNLTVALDGPHILKVLTLNIKTHGTLVLHGTKQLALIYRVYYKCMGTNMSIQAFDKRKPGETTLIQTSNVRSTVQVPRTLKWSEITFPIHWTLENENYPLQIQHPIRNPDLDVVQQLANGTVRLNFDQSRFKSPLKYEPSPRSSLDLHQDKYQEPRSRSVDLRQPFRQPAILLRDRPASQCSSSRMRTSRGNLGAQFQGVKDHSQVSTPCYTARQDSVADQEEDSNSQDNLKPPSSSGSDFRNPI